ncbi:hypothetical protein ACFB49_18420 [Sphingomonas sp. DBB INV C78]|uniref:hypothetical protein n=1 Tax=Sphingomonas sp. DBB INV C78 TaxID=3349434 RepID=UPI0036D368E3
MHFRASWALIALTLGASPLLAQDQPSQPPEKISTLVVYGKDPCPQSTEQEIVVCGREPENERYRVPKALREKKVDTSTRAWSDRVQQLEWVSRAGTPNSCSPVGSGGQTGCYNQLLRQARDEREQARRESIGRP